MIYSLEGIKGEYRMNKTVIKVVSAALAMSMVLSISACKKKNSSGGKEKSRSGEKIDANAPWFDGKEIKIENAYDTSRAVDYVSQRLAGVDDDYIVINEEGYYKMPDDDTIDWDKINYTEYMIESISVIDKKSFETINTIDIAKDLPRNSYIENISYANGVVSYITDIYDDTTYEIKAYETDIDIATGKELAKRDIDRDFDNGGYIENTFVINGYKIDACMIWDENDNGYYQFNVTDPDGNIDSAVLKEDDLNIWDVSTMLPIDSNTVLIPASTEEDMKYYTMDLSTLEIKDADMKEYDWLDLESVGSCNIGADGLVYYASATGINKLDLKKKSDEEIFNYSWCGVNRSQLSDLAIIEASEDRFLLCGENWSFSPFNDDYSTNFKIYELSRAAKNPHAGKTILELYTSYGYTNDQVADAILKFNDSNPDYFIEVTDRYSKSVEYEYTDSDNPDDYEKTELNYNAEMSNVLAMDIMNGEGPDILMDVSRLGQLNNTNYLADLTPYVSDLGSDKYYTNILDASKVDGVLYQFPISFYISGIQTSDKYAGKSGVGFTTGEYEKFLNEDLNGNDVINCGQAIYFSRLFTAMSDKFIVNGKADFKSDEFKDLAEFVKANVPEKAKTWDEMYSDDYGSGTYIVGASTFKGDRYGMEPSIAMDVNCYGIGSFLMNQAELVEGNTILGIPSSDGRGPCVCPSDSVAISAQAENIDACGEFIKLLLSEDMQMEYAMQDYFVLSRDAFRKVGKIAIDYYNGDGSYYFDTYDPMTGETLNNKKKTFTEKDIDQVENILLSCTRTSSADATINLILVEEMPAYFSGQKDLDAVITIAQDRVQKVLDERG